MHQIRFRHIKRDYGLVEMSPVVQHDLWLNKSKDLSHWKMLQIYINVNLITCTDLPVFSLFIGKTPLLYHKNVIVGLYLASRT